MNIETQEPALFVTSVLLQRNDADGKTTTSHTLHWATVRTHDEAMAKSMQAAKRLKRELEVVNVVCANTDTGMSKQWSFSENAPTVESE